MYYENEVIENRRLEAIPNHEIVSCLNLAFSDYYLPVQLTEEKLPIFLKTRGIDKKLSFGAFLGSQMVGVIFNSCNRYNGQNVVFDAGTGVVPEYRGKQVFKNLFRFAEQELKQYQIEKYYLEVLQQNDRAISLYQKLGFSVTREFVILDAYASAKEATHEMVTYTAFDGFDFENVKDCSCVKPSYEQSANILKLNPDFYEVAYVGGEGITAFCVFTKANGQIVQLGYRKIQDLRLIIQSLLSTFGHIIAKNIDKRELQVLEMFSSMGFHQMAEQFEMVKDMIMVGETWESA